MAKYRCTYEFQNELVVGLPYSTSKLDHPFCS